jgi:hypothetical protein
LNEVGVANAKAGAELADIFQEAWAKPLSDEQLTAERDQTAGELAGKYGVDGAKERIALANQVLARSPMLKNSVDVLELGNSFDLIETLADAGRELRKRGKL